jgi:hypothetical protein
MNQFAGNNTILPTSGSLANNNLAGVTLLGAPAVRFFLVVLAPNDSSSFDDLDIEESVHDCDVKTMITQIATRSSRI